MDNPHTRQAYYPLPFAILIIWVIYIILMLVCLEQAVRTSPLLGLTTSQEDLLAFLLTIFAQAHTPITTMFLTRLAVGALLSAGEISVQVCVN
jgi:hypothetical protein